MQINSDFEDLLRLLDASGARYLLVGGVALAFHEQPRFTKDMDIWIDREAENAARVYRVLAEFGAPLEHLTLEDLQSPDLVFQIGAAPVRIDVLTSVTGVEFADAWRSRLEGTYGAAQVYVIAKDDLVRNKRATGRTQDLADVERLEKRP